MAVPWELLVALPSVALCQHATTAPVRMLGSVGRGVCVQGPLLAETAALAVAVVAVV